MADPHEALGLEENAGPDQVRQRYLELVRTHTPEGDPQRFAQIQGAYEELRDPARRLAANLFNPDAGETIDDLVRQAGQRLTAQRLPTDVLLSLDKHSR